MSTAIESMLSIATFVLLLSAVAGALTIGFSSYYTSISLSKDIVAKSNERVRAAAMFMGVNLYVGVRNTGVLDETITRIYAIYPWYGSWTIWSGSLTLSPGNYYIFGPFLTYTAPSHVVVETSRGVFAATPVYILSTGGGYIGAAAPTDLWPETFAVNLGFVYMTISTTGYFIAFATYSTKNPYGSDVFSSIAPVSEITKGQGNRFTLAQISQTGWATHEAAAVMRDNRKGYFSGVSMRVAGWYQSLDVAVCAGYAFETEASFPAVLSASPGGVFMRYSSRGSLNLTYFDAVVLSRTIDPRYVATSLLSGSSGTSMSPGAGGVVYLVVLRCFKISYEYPRQMYIEVRSGGYSDYYRVYANGQYLGFGIAVQLNPVITGTPTWETGYPAVAVSYIPPETLLEMALLS